MLTRFYRKISTKLFGNKQEMSLEHRVLNVASLYSGVIALGFSLINFGLSLDFAYALLAPAGLCFLIIYGLSRFTPYFRQHTHWLALPCLVLMLAILSYLWTVNAGSQGGSQYFFFLAASAITVLTRGPLKAVSGLLLIATVAALIWMEHAHPEWILGYDSDAQRFQDILISFSAALFFFMIIMASITRNYEESYRKVETFRLHFSEDLTIAKGLQKRIYHSKEFDQIKTRYDLSLKHIPSAELSGDLYDLSEARYDGETALRIFLADARGHGINAALQAMLIKGEWENLRHDILSPAQVLQELNRKSIAHYGDAVSFSAVVTDLYTKKLVFASAGHDLQYLLKPGNIRQLSSSGPPIGIVEEAHYDQHVYEISLADRLLLFTDALSEELTIAGKAVGSEWFLDPALVDIRSSALLSDALIRRFAELRGLRPDLMKNTDDLTLIIVGHL